MYAFCPPVHTDNYAQKRRAFSSILLKTLLKVNRFKIATASVSVCTPKTHRLQNHDVSVTLSFHACCNPKWRMKTVFCGFCRVWSHVYSLIFFQQNIEEGPPYWDYKYFQLLLGVLFSHRHRIFWPRPWRTSAWWGNFVSQVVLPQEQIEDFSMLRSSVQKLSTELRPYIVGKATCMRQPVDVVKKVACMLYYLSDEGCMWKTANAFRISKQVVSEIVRDICYAITKHLGRKYIKVPFTEDGVRKLTEHFQKVHGIPLCLGAIDGTHIEIK